LNADIASFEVVSFITETQGVVNGKHDIVNITFTYAASCEGDFWLYPTQTMAGCTWRSLSLEEINALLKAVAVRLPQY
jgi:hypothetical protein